MKRFTQIATSLLVVLLFTPVLFAEETLRAVSKVINGDTIILEGGERVHLIGVACPDVDNRERNFRMATSLKIDSYNFHRYGAEARTMVRDMIEGSFVHLDLDEAHKGRRHKDGLGRTLAYVYHTNQIFKKRSKDKYLRGVVYRLDDNYWHININALLLKKGFCAVDVTYPFRTKRRFQYLAKWAKHFKRGIWVEPEKMIWDWGEGHVSSGN